MPAFSLLEWVFLGFGAAAFLELLLMGICLIKICHLLSASKEELSKLSAKLPMSLDKSEWPKRFWDWAHHLEDKHFNDDKPCKELEDKCQT